MTTTLKALLLGTLLSTIFLGCASKQNSTIACFKGSSACITQTPIPSHEKCIDCYATI